MRKGFLEAQSARETKKDFNCPRVEDNVSPAERLSRWENAKAGFQVLANQLGAKLSASTDQIATWPEEYQLRFYELLAKDPSLQSTMRQLQADRIEEGRADLIEEISRLTKWIASFKLPIGEGSQGTGWRRVTATAAQAIEFHQNFVPTQTGYAEVKIGKHGWRPRDTQSILNSTLRINRAAFEKAQVWVDLHSSDLHLETHGHFVLDTQQDGAFVIEDFIPQPSINADAWLSSNYRNSPMRVAAQDLERPGLLKQMFVAGEIGAGAGEQSLIPAPEGKHLASWHSHPLHWASGADRPSYGDFLSHPTGLHSFAFVWTPKNGHYLYIPSFHEGMHSVSSNNYYAATPEDLEERGLFQRIAPAGSDEDGSPQGDKSKKGAAAYSVIAGIGAGATAWGANLRSSSAQTAKSEKTVATKEIPKSEKPKKTIAHVGAREPSSPPENMGGVGVVALGVTAAVAALRTRKRTPKQRRQGKQIVGVHPISSKPGRGGRLLSIDPIRLAMVGVAGVPLLIQTAHTVADLIGRYGFSRESLVQLGASILTGIGAKVAGIEALTVGSVRESRDGTIFGGRPGKIIAKVSMENPSRKVPFEGNPDAFQGMEYPLGTEHKDGNEKKSEGFSNLLGNEGMKELQELKRVRRSFAGSNGIIFEIEFIPVIEKGVLVKVRLEASQIFGDHKSLFDQPREYDGKIKESKGETREANGTVVKGWLGEAQVAYRGRLYPLYHRAIFQFGPSDFYVFNGKRLIPFKINDLEVVDLPSLRGERKGMLTPHLFDDGMFFEMNGVPAIHESDTNELTAYGALNILKFTVFKHRGKKYFSDENRRQIYPVPEIYKELKISDGRTVYYDGHYFRELPKDETVLVYMPNEKQPLPVKTRSRIAMAQSDEPQLKFKFIDGWVVESSGYGNHPMDNSHPIFNGNPCDFVAGVVLGGKILRGSFKLGDIVSEPRTGRPFRLSFDPKRIASEPYASWESGPSEGKNKEPARLYLVQIVRQHGWYLEAVNIFR